MNALEFALANLEIGLTTVPLDDDHEELFVAGDEMPTARDIRKWFSRSDAIFPGVLTGVLSKNLCAIEFDTRHVAFAWLELSKMELPWFDASYYTPASRGDKYCFRFRAELEHSTATTTKSGDEVFVVGAGHYLPLNQKRFREPFRIPERVLRDEDACRILLLANLVDTRYRVFQENEPMN